jgi:DNA-binding transcriptional regulator LsrR (DeoR family)
MEQKTAAGLNNRELLVKVATMYYLQDLSQQQIAAKIGISRSYVSKMLKASRDLKIVEIRINDASSMRYLLREELIQRFGLLNAVVVPSSPDSEENKKMMGVAAAELLESLLKNDICLGISWGSSLYHMVNVFRPRIHWRLEVVQLMGGVGARDLNVDGYGLAQRLAEQLKARCYVLQAPLIVQAKSVRDMLLEEPDVAEPLKRAESSDVAVVGIGTNDPGDSALVRAGYLSEEQSRQLIAEGAEGNILGRHVDMHGNLCPIGLNDRIVGLEAEQLKKIPVVLGVAGGARKSKVILGALRGQYINTLVTDEAAAMGILSLERETQQAKGAERTDLHAGRKPK